MQVDSISTTVMVKDKIFVYEKLKINKTNLFITSPKQKDNMYSNYI